MKIRTIACTQFAGIRDRSVTLEDGINLIYGKNESGKSTLVNLLARVLFQNARIDGRKDREFKELYFPGERRGGAVTGDFADGRISFETEEGSYTLSKEWGSDARCSLSTPDGVIRDQKKIDAILKEALRYGEGVYADMLFSSQRNTDAALQTIMDASKKTDAKQEITDAVSQAFSESDGISADAIEQAIAQKIEEIAGKHWDMDRNLPARKNGGGRWANGVGEILKAYYALEDAEAVLATITQLEREADRAAAAYTAEDEAAQLADAAYERFQRVAGQLTLQHERRRAIERLEKESARLREVLQTWPQLALAVETAVSLKTELERCALLEQYEAARALMAEIETLRRALGDRACPTEQEIASVRTAQRAISGLENRLCGMNLSAAIRMFDGHSVRITSLRSGETIDLTDKTVSITEAVKISVPGVMELQLSPADVDVAAVEADIAAQKRGIAALFSRYEVDSLEALEQLARTLSDGRGRLEMLGSRLTMVLGATEYGALEAAAQAITETVRSRETVERDIRALCGGSDIVRYLAAKETVLAGYTAEYGSIEALKARAYDTETELRSAQDAVRAVQDLPAEYATIPDPEGHLALLQRELKTRQRSREEALTAKTAAAGRLENYKENLAVDPAANAETAARVFAEQKALLGHWLHIAEVCAAQKQRMQDSPMQDIAESFSRYLGLISDGWVSSEFPDPEKLNLRVYSGNSLLDYGKLSEGTKETVSLAFRLAVLDHLFPEGGGVIVFDDPFTDMDAERTAQSCALIKACAARHQVIFLTCKEEYTALLGGNVITMG